jgi:hypothetical protein
MINEFVKPGHFYSVIPNITKNYNNTDTKFINLDFNEEKHKTVLAEISDYLVTFDNTFGSKDVVERQKRLQYSLMNGAFEWMDARVLHYFLQTENKEETVAIERLELLKSECGSEITFGENCRLKLYLSIYDFN